ncbi:MAG: hydrogenase maturation protease [Candidatus Zixiibacteriota bacterium]|nr:MAG: hydrogenase maturation protease [candidate division Zixibacteria bacterium]
MSKKTESLVIGIGNEYRGDDAVGLYILRKLAGLAPGKCVLKESPGEAVHLINTWEGYRNVILVDAVRASSAAGTVHRIDAIRQKLPDNWVHHSAHTVSLPEAISLARTLRVMPDSLTIYGIEGTNFEPGSRISQVVKKAADDLIPEILARIESLK